MDLNGKTTRLITKQMKTLKMVQAIFRAFNDTDLTRSPEPMRMCFLIFLACYSENFRTSFMEKSKYFLSRRYTSQTNTDKQANRCAEVVIVLLDIY